jgi:hypothetical protein
LDKKVKILLDFFKKFGTNNLANNSKWAICNLKKLGINFEKDFILETFTLENVKYPISFKFDNITKGVYQKAILKDKSILASYQDDYLQDYSIFIDLSVPFEDMGMSYNALHLYEHLMTKSWNKLPGEDVLEMNGSTFPTGISYIYIICSTEKSFRLYAETFLKYLMKCRTAEFWNSKEMENFIQVETQRTISETRQERYLTSVGRTDQKGYSFGYKRDIFHYWANRPFNILLATKKLTSKIRISKFNSIIKTEKVKRPPNVKFDRMPFDVIKSKSIQKIRTVPKPIDVVVKEFFNDGIEEMLYGINCGLISERENLSVYNNILYPLLFLSPYVPFKIQLKYVNENIIPFSGEMFSFEPACLSTDNSEGRKACFFTKRCGFVEECVVREKKC